MQIKIIDKLRKLIRHKNSAEAIGSEHEAAAFAAKIQALLDEHNLGMSDIDIAEQQKTMGAVRTKVVLREHWVRILFSAIAETNGCGWFMTSKGFILTVVGEDADREVVLELFQYFKELAERLSIKYRDENRGTYFGTGGQYRKSFCLGFASVVGQRLRRAHREKMEQATQSTALVHIGNKLARANDVLKDYDVVMKPVTVSLSSAAGYTAGREAGATVSLSGKTIGEG